MSDMAVPALDDVELPTVGCWVAFRCRRDVYVVRGDGAQAWTLLDVRGAAVGTFRYVRAKYRSVGGGGAASADADWRGVVRAMCSAGVDAAVSTAASEARAGERRAGAAGGTP